MKKIRSHSRKQPSKIKTIAESGSKPINNYRLPIAIILVLAVILALLKFNRAGSIDLNKMKTQTIPQAVRKIINNEQSKIEVIGAKEVSGLVEFQIKINGKPYSSYISRDGKIVFFSGVVLANVGKTPPGAKSTKTTAKDIKKADKPSLTAYIVSGCPYGLQMQRIIKKAIGELPDLVDNLEMKYIGSVDNGKIISMHGENEAQENIRQICIREEQKEKYWPYVSCYMQEGKAEECQATANIDVTGLNSCTTDNKRGLTYAQADFDMANKLKVGSSPTLIVNGSQAVSEFDFGGRTPNAIKEILCEAAKNKPRFCAKTISKNEISASFSISDEAVAGNASPNTASGNGCAAVPPN